MKIRNGSFPMDWDETENALSVDGVNIEPSVRTVGDMAEVLADPKYARTALASDAEKSKILYYMHRNVHKKEDEKALSKFRRRYDVTVIPPAMLGQEYVKTIGHYHELSRKGVSFPELYEVMAGVAHFLIFKRKRAAGKDIDDKITDAVLIEAGAGDKVFVPCDYGHVMINPGRRVLVTNNIVEWKFKSIYEPVGKMAGAPYFELEGETTIPNERYAELSPLSKIKAKDYSPTIDLHLDRGTAIYDIFARDPEKFAFLEP
ncbi:MAG: glucose-6-phosphate isomerase family protein [Candidatus Micrarchaeia archaeon]|jgi:glucose-6-phosphate isomerase